MRILTFGNCCENAVKNHENAVIAAKNCGVDEPENISDLLEMIKYGVYTTPAIVIDGEVVSAGKRLSVSRIESLIKERL